MQHVDPLYFTLLGLNYLKEEESLEFIIAWLSSI